MIISKTPYRISFFGGGSDYPVWYKKYGGEVISTTIDKYLYISCRQLPNFFEHKYRVVYSKVEEVRYIDEIKHLVVKKALKNFDIKKNLEIHYDGELPSRSGVGSSSSFIVGFLNVLNFIKNKKLINQKDLASQSISFEQNIMQETVGSQDQIACAIGGINNLIFNKNGYLVKKIKNKKFFKKLNNNLILLYTQKQRYSSNVAKKFINTINSSKKKEILEILKCVKIAKKLIKSNDLLGFAELLNYSWQIKKNLHKKISNNFLNGIYDQAIKNGAIGGKILGAGSGGFFLFYVPEEKHKFFLKKMNSFTSIPFKFESEGSKIIFKDKNIL